MAHLLAEGIDQRRFGMIVFISCVLTTVRDNNHSARFRCGARFRCD